MELCRDRKLRFLVAGRGDARGYKPKRFFTEEPIRFLGQQFSGKIEIEREHPENSSVTAQIDVRSIDTLARPIRYAGTVPAPVLADVRAKLAAIIGL